MGIDEAGRGPVLGPMVYGCAYCAVAYKEELASLKFADSKILTEGKRERLFESLKEDPSMGWAVDVIDPRDLSAQMLRRVKRSLNDISYDSAIGLIKLVLSRGVLLSEVYVDTVGDAEKYQARLSELFPHIKFTVAKKADSLFPIVSAASIAAKVTRDQALKSWVMDEAGCAISRNFGSGYPGDPETKAWLEQHMDDVFGFPSLVRFSWATCKPLIAEGGVHVYWEADEDDDTALVKKSRSAQTESSGALRHSFFRSRQLQQVTTRL
ncbi:ribonuclease H2 subunit A [Selaginella moellendorffii]|uniref:ribonuclease H2 subunit A n=1 Tax=Selaginella moellendorffii TaxID=88036 RepID=UPI000D1C2996|nr:ribonuclease H2 subunit A [Selaginella moellendorffii]XP_024543061.1 ribonuclease H2 subunit A [Selaginella moellendorffii]|eukprot:XP_024543060.1 ribonuclease H2 subunit A [Selaginella moellendorffii]